MIGGTTTLEELISSCTGRRRSRRLDDAELGELSRGRCWSSGRDWTRRGCGSSPRSGSGRPSGRTVPGTRCRGWRGAAVSAGPRRARSWSWRRLSWRCPSSRPASRPACCPGPRPPSSDGPLAQTWSSSRRSSRPRPARRSRRWREPSTGGSSSIARRRRSRRCRSGSHRPRPAPGWRRPSTRRGPSGSRSPSTPPRTSWGSGSCRGPSAGRGDSSRSAATSSTTPTYRRGAKADRRWWSPSGSTRWRLGPAGRRALDSGAYLRGDAARRLACDAGVVRLLTDPDSMPLDVGRLTRSVSPAQARAVIHRDRHCRYEGCHSPPWACEVHHLDHWSRGGRTDVERLGLLCWHHHHLTHRQEPTHELVDVGEGRLRLEPRRRPGAHSDAA